MRGTRKQKAAELLRLVTNGPTLGYRDSQLMSLADVNKKNQLWLQSWIVPLVKDLLKKDLPPTPGANDDRQT